jgi:DNA-binding transcriptional LysR family regulator
LRRLEGLQIKDLIAFDAVMRELHVTRAAARLAMSQPALSHALQRLRGAFSDELFVRGPGGMIPTERAIALIGPIRRALADLGEALEPVDFDAALATDRFTLAMNNGAALSLAPAVVAAVRAAAPGATLVVRPSGNLQIDDLLDRGDLDLAIVGNGKVHGERFVTETLYKDGFAVAAATGHPIFATELTFASLCDHTMMHLTSTGDDTGFLAAIFDSLGQPGCRPALQMPLLSAGGVLETSDIITVVSQRIARVLARRPGVDWRPLPSHPEIPISRGILVWPRRLDRHPANVWLRGLVARCARDGDEALPHHGQARNAA